MQTSVVDRMEQVLSLTGFWELLQRRKWLVAGVFSGLLAASAFLVKRIPDTYEATMELMVKRARVEQPVDSSGTASVLASSVTESDISSEIELFRSRDSLETTVTRCGLVDEIGDVTADPRARIALAVQMLDNNLSVQRIDTTNMISVRFRHRDPERSAEVVHTLADAYLAKHLEVHRNQDTSHFFSEQTTLYEDTLAAAQRRLSTFRQRNKVSLLEAEKQATLSRQNELEREFQQTKSEIEDARDRVTRLRAQVAGQPETIETSIRSAKNQALLERLKTSLLDLENKRTELLTKYDSSYRLVREVEQQIRDTRAALETEGEDRVVDRTEAPNPLRQTLEEELLRTETLLSGLEARCDSTARDLDRTRAELLKLEGITAEHDDLVRQVKLAEENYLLYQKKLEESRLEDAMDRQRILNVSVVQDAAVPAVPSERYEGALLLLGAIMAAFGSLALAFAVDVAVPQQTAESRREELVQLGVIDVVLHDRRKTAAEACNEAGEETPAGSSPEAEEARRGDRGPRHAPQQPAAEDNATELALFPPKLPPGETGTPGVVAMMSRNLALRDEYGAIIDYLNGVQGPGRGIAIGLSPEIGPEDAAVAAVQLAYSMQQRNGLPVLLVDACDGGRPLAAFFGLGESQGLRDLISGAGGNERECIHRTGFGDLWILPQGRGQWGEEASSSRVDALHRALANRSKNLVVHLPNGNAGGTVTPMLYSVLDGVLSSLQEVSGSGMDADALVRKIVEAKRNYSERRLTLVGGAKQWSSGDAESLTVC